MVCRMRRAAGPDHRDVKALGSTARCRLAVSAFRLLLETPGGGHPVTTMGLSRRWRLQAKLDAAVAVFTPAERAYYDDQVGLLATRERGGWR